MKIPHEGLIGVMVNVAKGNEEKCAAIRDLIIRLFSITGSAAGLVYGPVLLGYLQQQVEHNDEPVTSVMTSPGVSSSSYNTTLLPYAGPTQESIVMLVMIGRVVGAGLFAEAVTHVCAASVAKAIFACRSQKYDARHIAPFSAGELCGREKGVFLICVIKLFLNILTVVLILMAGISPQLDKLQGGAFTKEVLDFICFLASVGLVFAVQVVSDLAHALISAGSRLAKGISMKDNGVEMGESEFKPEYGAAIGSGVNGLEDARKTGREWEHEVRTGSPRTLVRSESDKHLQNRVLKNSAQRELARRDAAEELLRWLEGKEGDSAEDNSDSDEREGPQCVRPIGESYSVSSL